MVAKRKVKTKKITKSQKTVKRSSKVTRKYTNPKPGYRYQLLKKGLAVGAGLTLAAATLFAARKMLKKQSKPEIKDEEYSSESDSEDEEFRETLNLQQEIKKLNDQINNLKLNIDKEKQGNASLVNQINQCNKEVLRQRSVISSRPSLLKEATMRSTINKLKKTQVR